LSAKDKEKKGRASAGDAGAEKTVKREYWKPSNMLYPVPAVLVCCADENGRANVMTAAWAGTICSDPVMLSVSIRKERFSHDIIKRTGEFTVCLTTEAMAKAVDYVGVRSGRDIDKFALEGELKLTKIPSEKIAAPAVAESPVCLECVTKQILELGSHDMFIAEVVCSNVDPRYLDENGRFDLSKAGLLAYSHGEYYGLGAFLGKFGYSVKKKK
jgi:flavin reductase (DIM6/NTAB) family NADH-FMN oxidoreductase RutF